MPRTAHPALSLSSAPAPEPEAAPLGEAEARRLTDELKRDTAALNRRLRRLYERGVHTALGYSSWHTYCAAEFGFGRSHSYRLRDAGEVAEVVPQVGNEAQARQLVRLLREQGAPAVVELVRDLEARQGEPPTALQYRHAVSERLAIIVPAGSDQAPAATAVPTSEPGGVYELGSHRLVCGDARDVAVLAALLGDERASMIWTDPPYGVDYVGKTVDALTIQNDGSEGLRELLVGAWQAAAGVLIESAPYYVAGPTGRTAEDFLASFREAGWRYQQQLVWVKRQMVLGRQNYQMRHEAIYHGHGPGRNAGRVPDRFRWYGDDTATSVFEVASPSASPDHPTTKPVELIIPAIRNSSLPGEIVLDPFAGSGSTMIAAEHAGRRAFLVEIDPSYCDVIRRRWHNHHAG